MRYHAKLKFLAGSRSTRIYALSLADVLFQLIEENNRKLAQPIPPSSACANKLPSSVDRQPAGVYPDLCRKRNVQSRHPTGNACQPAEHA